MQIHGSLVSMMGLDWWYVGPMSAKLVTPRTSLSGTSGWFLAWSWVLRDSMWWHGLARVGGLIGNCNLLIFFITFGSSGFWICQLYITDDALGWFSWRPSLGVANIIIEVDSPYAIWTSSSCCPALWRLVDVEKILLMPLAKFRCLFTMPQKCQWVSRSFG